MKRTLVFLLSLIPFVATAGIFKCVVDGKTTFSQRPCGDDAQEIELKYRAASADPVAPQTQGQPSYQGSIKADQVIRDRKSRAKQAEIKKYQRQMDKELAALRHKKRYAANNLAGATWEESISTEMQAVAERYRSKIAIAREELGRVLPAAVRGARTIEHYDAR